MKFFEWKHEELDLQAWNALCLAEENTWKTLSNSPIQVQEKELDDAWWFYKLPWWIC